MASISSSANPSGGHGGGVRGANLRRRSPQFEGRFGRMFRDLPPATWSHAALMELGRLMSSDPERGKGPERALPAAALETGAIVQDDEENSGIPAGYTYFGQFIDHDLTFDPASLQQKINDPDALIDFRTPRFDLDSLYGRGPSDEPYMFVPSSVGVASERFRLGTALTMGHETDAASPIVPSDRVDLPRYTGPGVDPSDPSQVRAIIGDKRNDENVIVGQLHASFQQLHNKLAETYPKEPFTDIQRRVRWHYQWLVINDFLPRICGPEVLKDILPHRLERAPATQQKPQLQFFKYKHQPYMPLEFAVAAYRFGHSMVRPIYRLNTVHHGGDDPLTTTKSEDERGLTGRFFVFAGVQNRGLNGFGKINDAWAIDWSLFFDHVKENQDQGGTLRTQPSYKIDTSLVNPLAFLPEFSTIAPGTPPLTIKELQAKPIDKTTNPANLAQRNLLRGMIMELPSGQDVAEAMGLIPLTDAELTIGKALMPDAKSAKSITTASDEFEGKAPLWFYVLAEATHQWRRSIVPGEKKETSNARPVHLGPVGARIVAETFIGLMAADGSSYLTQKPNWTPQVVDGSLLDTMGALLRWVDEPQP